MVCDHPRRREMGGRKSRCRTAALDPVMDRRAIVPPTVPLPAGADCSAVRSAFVGDSEILAHNAACNTIAASVPRRSGVYTVHFANGEKYHGMSRVNMHSRIHRHMRNNPDVVRVTHRQMPARKAVTFERRLIRASTFAGVRLRNSVRYGARNGT
jgi:hypothetical protein